MALPISVETFQLSSFLFLLRMKLPGDNCLGLTFLLYQFFVSFWYFLWFWIAFILSSSSKSLLVTCSSSSIIWTFVLGPWNYISSGVIASSPYNNLNGVKFVDLDTVVLCAQTTCDNSSTHFPLGRPTRCFEIPVHIIPFSLSTAVTPKIFHSLK